MAAFADGREIGYDFDDATLKMLTLPYMRGTLIRTPVTYDIGAGLVAVALTAGTKTAITLALQPTITIPDGTDKHALPGGNTVAAS